MNNAFINPQYQALLERNYLDSFNALWEAKIDWFEEPNVRRGGWSGVGQLRLQSTTGDEVLMYVKKQQDHGRRTWRHPIQGEPTFKREFNNLQFLDQKAFAAPRVIYYGEENTSGHQRAILATLALDQHHSLDEWMQLKHVQSNRAQSNHSSEVQFNDADKKQLLGTIAQSIRQLHSLGVVHRALYPKHIFIKPNSVVSPALTSDISASDIAVIDLEKARLSSAGWYRTYFDLAALFRHATWWGKEDQQIFFKAYCGKAQLSCGERWMLKKIQQRAAR